MSPESREEDPEAERARFRKEMERLESVLQRGAGLAFAHKELLHQAFQHRSYLKDNKRALSYERLEFLGDRVLELCVSKWLFDQDPGADEGALSKELSWRVDESNLARVEKDLQVRRALRISQDMRADEISDKMVADVVEALIGAIYIDVGLEAAWRFIEAYVPLKGRPPADFHSTNQLLETCVRIGLPAPRFNEASEGPANEAKWKVECVVGNERTIGLGKRKRDAKKESCLAMLALLSSKGDRYPL